MLNQVFIEDLFIQFPPHPYGLLGQSHPEYVGFFIERNRHEFAHSPTLIHLSIDKSDCDSRSLSRGLQTVHISGETGDNR